MFRMNSNSPLRSVGCKCHHHRPCHLPHPYSAPESRPRRTSTSYLTHSPFLPQSPHSWLSATAALPPPPPSASPRRSMDALRPRRSPDSDRFLGLFSPPTAASPAAAGGGTGDPELDEDDVFWPGADDSDSGSSMSIPIPIPNPSPSFAHSPFRNRHFGILAALPEDDPAPLLQRKPSLTASSASTSPASSSSSARMIPKPKPADYAQSQSRTMSLTRGYHHQSVPVNVPAPPPRPRRDWGELDLGEAGEEGEEEMLPPHEIVARASAKESPMTTFSVLEGVGRTLKGRDLRRVRNAVWRKTGFLD